MKVSILQGADSPGTEGPEPLRGDRLRRFRAALRAWYGPRARPLRIRGTRDPWAILVSEVMSQQTQIGRVDEAWVAFMERYPTPRALAAATPADVLRAWAGLGYNRRALNLQRAAAVIEDEHGGLVPRDIDELEKLPGVGPYTARAVAAIAFGQPVAAVDTNVRRVVTRVLGRPLSPKRLQAEADALVDADHPDVWTHASMELGATICISRAPRCHECPVAAWCLSAGRVEVPIRRAAPSGMAFELTTRWLRGRIIERLRALDEGEWHALPGSIGEHDAAEIETAVEALAGEGLLERRPDGSVRLPSS